MSSNRAFLKFLQNIQYSSVSNQNLKYNKVFKEYSVDTLIERNDFKNTLQQKWLLEEENKTDSKLITTNDKLKQIINSNKNLYKIQQAFFKTFDKEPIFNKFFNKEKKDENQSNKFINKKSNKSASKIYSLMKMKQTERQKNPEFYKRRWEEINRKPPLGLYNPKYNYIEKHIPGFNFHIEPTISRKTISFKKFIEPKKDKKAIINNSKSNSKNNSKINSKNNSTINNNSSNYSTTPANKSKKIYEFKSSMDANKRTGRNNNNRYKLGYFPLKKNQENVFLSQINSFSQNKTSLDSSDKDKEKVLHFNYTPNMISKNIPVPIFSKMTERFGNKNINKGHITNADYSPNYNAIYINPVNLKPIDYEKRKKKNYLKKIITNYNQIKEYELFPELNNI